MLREAEPGSVCRAFQQAASPSPGREEKALQGRRVLPLQGGRRGEQAAPLHISALCSLCSLLRADAVL